MCCQVEWLVFTQCVSSGYMVTHPVFLALSAVFNEDDDHSYCHHEILITAFPLAIEWLDYHPENPQQKGGVVIIVVVVVFVVIAIYGCVALLLFIY